MSACSFLRIAGEVPLGTRTANQRMTSTPGNPDSEKVGTSGKLSSRLAEVTASPRSAPLRMCGREDAVPFNAGLAEAVVRQPFDPVDIVTEVINRAEEALATSVAEGPGKLISLAAAFSTAAVA